MRITNDKLRTIGYAIRRFLKTDEAYAKYLSHGGTWRTGGCWLLAEALRREFKRREVFDGWPATQLIALVSDRGPEHVALGAAGWAWDADGATRLNSLLARWAREELLAVEAVPLTNELAQRAAERGIPVPEEAQIRALARDLRAVIDGRR